MTNAYYTRPTADTLYPIFGVSSLEEARQYAGGVEVIESPEVVMMNPSTGSVDFESGWEDTDGLVEVRFDAETESWIEA